MQAKDRRGRLSESVEVAINYGNGIVIIDEDGNDKIYSRILHV